MKKVHVGTALVAATTITLLAGCGSNSTTLSGTYVPTGHAGVGGQWAFHKDGTITVSRGGISMQATYTRKGSKVTITAPQAAGGQSQDFQIDDKGCIAAHDQTGSFKLCKQ